jgi:CHAT domain-containing protein
MHANQYLTLADQLYHHLIDEADLPTSVALLPSLNQSLLEELATEAEKAAKQHPRQGWTITKVANAAAFQQKADLFLQSLSAWYLGRAANAWVHPLLVSQAIHQARAGFLKLNKPAWVAACDWQLNELSWTKTDQTKSAKVLKKALQILESSNLRNFSPYCRLALASNQLFLNQVEETWNNLKICETAFLVNHDLFGQAQCSLTAANYLRQQSRFVQSSNSLESALKIFLGENNIPCIGRTIYQQGLISLFSTTDIAKTVSLFEQADGYFLDSEVDLWHGICQSYLGMAILQDGQLERAEQSFEEAKKVFHRHHNLSQLADAYTASGLLNLAKGNSQASIDQFKKAKRLYLQVGRVVSVGVDSSNLGKAYRSSGRYQDALSQQEEAKDLLTSVNNSLAVADCEADIASTWFFLHDYPRALDHLKIAEDLYHLHQQNASLTSLSNLKARIYFESNDTDNAILCLKNSLARSLQFKLRPQAALAHRLIGELFIRNGRFPEAEHHLQNALRLFTNMGMGVEHAACLKSRGDYYRAIEAPEKAEKSYRAALTLSDGSFVEIDWRAYAGLASLAEKAGDQDEALRRYRKSINCLSKIRSNFWQANLAGSYSSKPIEVFSRAIPVAITCQSAEDVAVFIEADKAVSLSNPSNFTLKPNKNKTTNELETLVEEINWLQSQMSTSTNSQNNLNTALQTRQYRQRLVEKSKKYDELNSHLERKSNLHEQGTFPLALTLNDICLAFEHVSGKEWVAINYYLTNDQVFLSLISPKSCKAYQINISARARIALEACEKSQQNGKAPEPTDLHALGQLLFPRKVRQTLDPEKTLIISPHNQLHSIPWNALQIGQDGSTLVENCIPVIVPSLQSAAMMWSQTGSKTEFKQGNGIVVGVSEFMGIHPELPFVKKEVEFFATNEVFNGLILQEENASWKNLLQISLKSHGKGLSNYMFLHLASHFFSDSVSGRLSGMALWGESIYQDQLRELAPLPDLVTLSGCSSIFSCTYPGDEHVGLATTCLMAGAKSIIGSNWPVTDISAVDFMTTFYRYHMQGSSPAVALAKTQRAFIQDQKEVADWAGYCCIGKP